MAAENDDERPGSPELKALADRLRRAVEQAGGNKRVAEEAAIPLRTLNMYLRAEADPKVTRLARIAAACGTNVDALLSGKSHDGEAESRVIAPHIGEDLPAGYIAIPKLAVRASAGPGRAVSPSDFAGSVVAFREAWLRTLGIRPDDAEFLQAEGDSMEPTINDGDLMLVDRGYGEVANGKIYVLVRDGLVIVKRLQLLAVGGLMLISDNPRYPTETIARGDINEVNIEARVAWFGRAI